MVDSPYLSAVAEPLQWILTTEKLNTAFSHRLSLFTSKN